MYTPLNLRTQVDLTTSGFSCNCRGLQCEVWSLVGPRPLMGRRGRGAQFWRERAGVLLPPASVCTSGQHMYVASESNAPWPACCVISGMPLPLCCLFCKMGVSCPCHRLVGLFGGVSSMWQLRMMLCVSLALRERND